jgi:hypothetical protein
VEHRTSGEKDTVLAAPNDLAVLYDDGPERAAPAFLDDSIASRVASSRNLLLSALVVALAGRAGSTAAVASAGRSNGGAREEAAASGVLSRIANISGRDYVLFEIGMIIALPAREESQITCR